MAKSAERVRQKMLNNVRTAGTELIAGMQAAEDPARVILSNANMYQQKYQAGVQEAIKNGSWTKGLQKAADENKWKGSIQTAGQRYEQAADTMVANSMKTYAARMQVIEQAKAAVASMPTATTDQRIAKSAAYQKKVSELFKAAGFK